MTKPMTSDSEAKENTDRELYREPSESEGMSYYANSIHVTKEGSIGMNVGGMVIVMPLKDWHDLAMQRAKVAEEGSSTDDRANAEPSRELAKEAQSEAPSVVDELENILDRLAVRMYDEGQLDKPSLMGRQVAIVNINEAKAKINRLITEARIDELKRISKFKGLEWPSTARATYIENRIEELS